MSEEESIRPVIEIDYKTISLTRQDLYPGTVLRNESDKKVTDIDNLPLIVGSVLNTSENPVPLPIYFKLSGEFKQPTKRDNESLNSPSKILRTTASQDYDYKGALINPKATILNKEIVRQETGFLQEYDEFWDDAVALELSATGLPDGDKIEIGRVIILHAKQNSVTTDVYVLPTEENEKVKALIENRNIRSSFSAHDTKAKNLQNPLDGGLPGQNN